MFKLPRGEPRSLIPIHVKSPGNQTSGSSQAECRVHGSEFMGPSPRDPITLNELLAGRRDTLLPSPMYDSIRGSARFQALLRRLGLAR